MSPLSEEECRVLSLKEFPYQFGNGQSSVQKRTRRLKQLLKQNGHSTRNPWEKRFTPTFDEPEE